MRLSQRFSKGLRTFAVYSGARRRLDLGRYCPQCIGGGESRVLYCRWLYVGESGRYSHATAVFPAKAGIQRRRPCVYLLASKRNGTLYVGVTSNLTQRVWQHKSDLAPGFTKRFGVYTLVWYEAHDTMESAIVREKRIKDWKRAWKIVLIEKSNPRWLDLYDEFG